jgi:hypothetical protein
MVLVSLYDCDTELLPAVRVTVNCEEDMALAAIAHSDVCQVDPTAGAVDGVTE